MSASLTKKETFKRFVSTLEGMLQVNRVTDMRPRPDINPDTDLFNDLEVDSLEAMDLITAIEEEFEITLNPEILASKRNIGEIVNYLESCRKDSVA